MSLDKVVYSKGAKVYLYTGTSGGKTTNSLGIAMRTLAHGKSVLMIQFLKWDKNTGEYIFSNTFNKLQESYGKTDIPNVRFEVQQFGRDGWHGFDNLNDEDKKLCDDAVRYTYEMLAGSSQESNPERQLGLLILDEVNIAAHYKLVSIEDIKSIIKICKTFNINVVLTGRLADAKMIKLADIVNEIICLKEPDENHMIYQQGVQV